MDLVRQYFITLTLSLLSIIFIAIGNALSLADVSLYTFVCEYFDDKEAALDAVSSCPKILNSCEKVKVAAATWLATRPVNPF